MTVEDPVGRPTVGGRTRPSGTVSPKGVMSIMVGPVSFPSSPTSVHRLGTHPLVALMDVRRVVTRVLESSDSV